jgi:tripartite-type tricarboxylate transporter receptor subunit TctC
MIKQLICSLAAVLAFSTPALGQMNASRPVKIVVPFSPGGSTDQVARLLAEKLKDKLAQTVIVENRAGGGGNIAIEHVLGERPDGHTLLIGVTASQAAAPWMFKSLPYDVKDLTTIAVVADQPQVVVVHPGFKAKDFAELIAIANEQPMKVNAAMTGTGLQTDWITGLTKIKVNRVPYKGGSQAMVDLVGGQVDMMVAVMPEVLQFVKSGKLRALAVTTKQRSAIMPGVPTVYEAGYKDADFVTWISVAASAKIPRAVAQRLNEAITEIVSEPAFQARFRDIGLEPRTCRLDECNEFVKAEIAKYKHLTQALGIQPQ